MEVDEDGCDVVSSSNALNEMAAVSEKMEVKEDYECNDVVSSSKISNEMAALSDKPIMILFKRLIGNENKQNTVLTNDQIINLLEKEFDMNTEELHELEMEIYLSITKKFLKDWPQWDEFDTAINMMKKKNDHAETEKMLLSKYRQLKNYLSAILDTVSPIAKDKVVEIEKKFSTIQEELQRKEVPPVEDFSDLILEIQCSRPQLNSLILKHPHPEQQYTIFNTIDSGPSKIFLDTLSYEAMLNWWDIEICFKMQHIHFVRSTAHGIKHTLINKRLLSKNKAVKLRSGYQEKPAIPGKMPDLNILKKKRFAEILRRTFLLVKDAKQKHYLTVILNILEKDLAGLPNDLQECMSYRKYFSKYAYIRDLSTDVPEAKKDKEAMNYDLHLREQISPMYQLDILKVEQLLNINSLDFQNIYVKCKSCSYKFSGVKMLEQLRLHILDHLHEPDWQCMKCKESFTMVHLAKNRWHHVCKDDLNALIVKLKHS